MIHRNNEHFRYLDDHHQTILYRKQNKEKDKFDRIVFASRGINEMKIQSFIKIVELYSFDRCNNLNQIELCENSSLEIINENSFSHSSLQTISIPSQIKTISSGAFSWCKQLTSINFESGSQLQKIERGAFSGTSIEQIRIPQRVVSIGENCFTYIKAIQKLNLTRIVNFNELRKKRFLILTSRT